MVGIVVRNFQTISDSENTALISLETKSLNSRVAGASIRIVIVKVVAAGGRQSARLEKGL